MSADNTQYQSFQPAARGYWLALAALLFAAVVGAYCAYNMEHAGHAISGMNNSVVWGLPHVFAISLILAASGALNGATLSSVFDNKNYKPWARLSVILAIALLVGGLSVLVLDLGRPDRLWIAMTTYNFRSIFSWNIFLYNGFIVLGFVYLGVMLDRKLNRHVKSVGIVALIWRIVLTTGTGCIFGFLVGRSALDSAIMAPLFIALSLVMGTAVFALVVMLVSRWQGTALGANLTDSLCRLLLWCVLALFYFSVVHHLTNLYVAQHHSDERHILAGSHALLFWLGHIGVGISVPIWLLFRSLRKSPAAVSDSVTTDEEKPLTDTQGNTKALLVACFTSLLGGMVMVYLVVIGSQSSAQLLFPGKTVTASSFGDMGDVGYLPGVWEWGLGIGGVSLSLLLLLFMLRILPASPSHKPL